VKADRALWIDAKGKLHATVPVSGMKIASGKGTEIQDHIVKRYGLETEDGRVMQEGKPPRGEEKAVEVVENKAMGEAPNKGGSGGLTVKTRRGRKSGKGAS